MRIRLGVLLRSRWGGAGLAFIVSLVCSLVVAEAIRPEGLFPKYLEAAGAPDPVRAERALDYSPLYLAIARVLAPAGAAGLLWMQCLLHALTSASLALTVGCIAGESWALVAGLGAASYRPFLVYCGVEEPEIAILACLGFATLLGVVARGHPAGSARRLPAGVPALGASAAICAAGLLRPQYLLLLPVWWIWMGSASRARADRIRVWAGGLLAAAVLVLPVLISRSLAAGFPVIMNPGPVFYEGNCPAASGLVRHAPETVRLLEKAHPAAADYGHVAYRRIAGAAAALSAGRSNSYWTALALQGIRAFPGAALSRFGQKSLMSIMPHEGHDLRVAEDLDRRIRRRIPWGFELLLIGGPLLIFARREILAPLCGPIAIGVLSVLVQIVFYASARQRLPLAFALLVIGPVVGSEWWRQRLRVGAGRPLLAALAIAVAALVAFASGRVAILDQLEWDRVLPPARWSTADRIAALLDGRSLRARTLDEAARFAASVDLVRVGRAREAVSILEPLCRRRLDFSISDATIGVPEYWLAVANLALHDRSAAVEWVKAAATMRPGEPRIAALSLRLEDPERFVSRASDWTLPGCDPVTARWVLATAAADDGDPEAARLLVRPLARSFPELGGPPDGP